MFGILAFGDSITFGRGSRPSYSWAELFKKDFEKKDSENVFYNLGVPGDTSKTLLNRIEIESDVRIQKYRENSRFVILIMTGTNDTKVMNAKIETKSKLFKSNYKKIIKKALKYTNDIIIIGLTPVDERKTQPFQDKFFSNETILEYNQILREIALENNLKFIDVFMLEPHDFADGLHPNKKGHKKLYHAIKNELHF